ncbi:MAG: hypothetical protein ACRCS3_15970 [Paracoccaceae bacterium]
MIMNAAVNNSEDDPPLDVAMQQIVQQYGALRVLMGLLRQVLGQRRPVPLALSAHLRRDIGLPPEDDGFEGR